jgi:hypothetical protein
MSRTLTCGFGFWSTGWTLPLIYGSCDTTAEGIQLIPLIFMLPMEKAEQDFQKLDHCCCCHQRRSNHGEQPYKPSLVAPAVVGLAARCDHNGLAVLLRDGSEGPG